MKNVAITGASGMVGAALLPALSADGWQVVKLQRLGSKQQLANESNEDGTQSAGWNPDSGELHFSAGEFPDAIVHLAGENIAGSRWSASVKQRIRSSRVEPTKRLCEWLAKSSRKPSTLVCASAIGFYGERGDQRLTEDANAGDGFLADVCRDWEAATKPAVDAGIRVVNLRFGMILSAKGGALAKMLTPFRLGGGGIVGNGQQYWSWITLEDAVGVIKHALTTESLSGPVNAVAPESLTNHDFTKTLGQVLHRPTVLPLPAFAARLMLGEMADELLLASARVVPAKLEAAKYSFQYPSLATGLRHALGIPEKA